MISSASLFQSYQDNLSQAFNIKIKQSKIILIHYPLLCYLRSKLHFITERSCTYYIPPHYFTLHLGTHGDLGVLMDWVGLVEVELLLLFYLIRIRFDYIQVKKI
jgi:hypothetical protein